MVRQQLPLFSSVPSCLYRPFASSRLILPSLCPSSPRALPLLPSPLAPSVPPAIINPPRLPRSARPPCRPLRCRPSIICLRPAPAPRPVRSSIARHSIPRPPVVTCQSCNDKPDLPPSTPWWKGNLGSPRDICGSPHEGGSSVGPRLKTVHRRVPAISSVTNESLEHI